MNETIKFGGMIYPGGYPGGRDHYSLQIYNKNTGEYCGIGLCQGSIYKHVGSIEIDSESKNNHTYAWGYDGVDADLTSITLLALSLRVPWDRNAGGGNFPLAGKLYYWGHMEYENFSAKPYCADVPGLIKKYYRDFTQEVVMHLPDEWKMTSDEVVEWVNKKEAELCPK